MTKDLTNEFRYMMIALFLAFKALMNNETPVSCIFVDATTGKILSLGYNGTNDTLNGTRHAELVAIDYILVNFFTAKDRGNIESIRHYFLNVVCYVTVEPCIMCASALRQIGIKHVVFGCGNDRFGGNGTVLSINRDPSIDPEYLSYGGILRTEAIMLLRNFYIQENNTAPVPKIKKNKQLEGKEFPENINFEKYLSREEFLDFYGPERLFLWSNRSHEVTPRFGSGYCLPELLNEKLLEEHLQSLFSDIDGLEDFHMLLYDINDDGTVDFKKKVVTVEEKCTKKRKLTENCKLP